MAISSKRPRCAAPKKARERRPQTSVTNAMVWTPAVALRHRDVPDWKLVNVQYTSKGESVVKITTSGIDVAKSVFQVHGVDGHGKVVLRRQLRRC